MGNPIFRQMSFQEFFRELLYSYLPVQVLSVPKSLEIGMITNHDYGTLRWIIIIIIIMLIIMIIIVIVVTVVTVVIVVINIVITIIMPSGSGTWQWKISRCSGFPS